MRIVVVILAILVVETALADPSNRNLVPLGDEEALQGNAGTGRQYGGAGAVYYNPARLANVENTSLSVSGSVYGFLEIDADPLLVVDDEELGFSARKFNPVPAFVGSTFRFGKTTLGLSVLVPEALDFEHHELWRYENVDADLLQHINIQDLWLGASVGRKLNDQWAVGATLFGINHSSVEQTAITTANEDASSLSVSLVRAERTSRGLSATVGVLYMPTHWLSIGARLQSPFLRLSHSDTVFQLDHFSGDSMLASVREELTVDDDYVLPLDASLGVALHGARWNVALDLSVQGPAEGNAARQSYKTMWRGNLGGGYRLGKALSIDAGFAYNPSADDGLENADRPPLDYFGFTMGLIFKGKRSRTGLGAYLQMADGQFTANPNQVSNWAERHYGVILVSQHLLGD